MSTFTDQAIDGWRNSPSTTEATKLANAERMVREALTADAGLNNLTIEVYGQGSYANDTNVRLNSDVDINVRLASPLFLDFPAGKSMHDYNYIPTDYTFSQYKGRVLTALENHFGKSEVTRLDKCIRIKENSYRIACDVVPTWKYNRHEVNESVSVGAKFLSDSGNEIPNFALQHITNGKIKNAATQDKFKYLTRILKKVKYKMEEDNYYKNDKASSFLLECLVWQIPNTIFGNPTWNSRLTAAILHLYTQTQTETTCQYWTEVSGYLYLFHTSRKWKIKDANEFMQYAWNYLGLAVS